MCSLEAGAMYAHCCASVSGTLPGTEYALLPNVNEWKSDPKVHCIISRPVEVQRGQWCAYSLVECLRQLWVQRLELQTPPTELFPPHSCCLPKKPAQPSSSFLIQFLFLLISSKLLLAWFEYCAAFRFPV